MSRDGAAILGTVAAGLVLCAPTFALVVALNTSPADAHRPPLRPAPAVLWGPESEPGFWGEVHPAATRDGVRSPLPAARRG